MQSNFRKKRSSYHSSSQETLEAEVLETDWHSKKLSSAGSSECSHKNRFWNAKKRIPTWSFQGRISFNSQLSKHLQASVLYKPSLCPHRWLSIHELSGLWSSFPLSIWLLNSEMRYDLNNFLRTVWLMSFVLLLSLALQGVTPRIGSTSLLILVSPSWQSKTTMGAWSTRWSAFISCVPRRTVFT